jgi:TolB-like protein/Tfp pilus assembly protein PilF
LRYLFEEYTFDTGLRELHRGSDVVSVAPQVFDLLDYLISNRERVVSKEDLINAVWKGRIVSDAALTTRLNVARSAIGDTGDEQRLIKTLPRKGFRFVGQVRATDAAVADDQTGPTTPVRKLPHKPSLAVLPFTNLSSDPEQEYFAEGMVEELTTALSRSKRLFVIARRPNFAGYGRPLDISQVGSELGVRYLLEGSVRKAGKRVRITGQLIDVDSGIHLWADRFDGELEDIFDLQDRIAGKVVNAIFPKLRKSEIERASRKSTVNLTAYDYYLRGASIMSRRDRETFADALPLLKKAIECDPEFAPAYAAAAAWYPLCVFFGRSIDREQEKKTAVALARKSIELDRDDAFVLSRSGWTLAIMAGELDEGADYLARATDADPNSAYAWSFRGMTNVLLGRHEEAIEYFEHALSLSPLDPAISTTYLGLAYADFFSGRYERSLHWFDMTLRHSPTWQGTRRLLIACLALSGQIDAAKATFESARQGDPTLRISTIRERFPLRRDEDLARVTEGYRLAGVPE